MWNKIGSKLGIATCTNAYLLVGLVVPLKIACHTITKSLAFIFRSKSGFTVAHSKLYALKCNKTSSILVCYIGIKKVGNIKIGGPDAKPTMSKWNWVAISLCGGIATGIVFWGIAEPITHFIDGIPGLVEGGGTRMSALYALSTCYMHWGLPLYAYYCAAGIAIGVCVYNLKQPYNVSSSLYPLLGERANGAFGSVVDLLCVFGIAGGVSASLGVASMQLGAGLGILANFTPNAVHWAIIMVFIVATFIISSYSGINRGVRWLSDKNAKIYMLLLIYVFFCAQTKEILAMGTESMGFFAQNWIVQNTYLGAMADGASTSMWPTWWTINYWSFMIAYSCIPSQGR